jgi:hypothetical protein
MEVGKKLSGVATEGAKMHVTKDDGGDGSARTH